MLRSLSGVILVIARHIHDHLFVTEKKEMLYLPFLTHFTFTPVLISLSHTFNFVSKKQCSAYLWATLLFVFDLAVHVFF